VGANHTGSASFDAVLTPELKSSATFFLNGTNAQYDSGLSIPWGIDLAGDENYSGNPSPLMLDMAREVLLSI